MTIFNPGDRVRRTDAGWERMTPASTSPHVGVYLGLAIGWKFIRVEGVDAKGRKHVGSYHHDSWEKDK